MLLTLFKPSNFPDHSSVFRLSGGSFTPSLLSSGQVVVFVGQVPLVFIQSWSWRWHGFPPLGQCFFGAIQIVETELSLREFLPEVVILRCQLDQAPRDWDRTLVGTM